jgi:hypothetical protein
MVISESRNTPQLLQLLYAILAPGNKRRVYQCASNDSVQRTTRYNLDLIRSSDVFLFEKEFGNRVAPGVQRAVVSWGRRLRTII